MPHFFAVLLIILLNVSPAMADCERPLKVAWNDYPPYAFKNGQNEMDGLDVKILRSLSSITNCPIEFVEVPPKRTFSLMERGMIDITAAASRTPERETFAHFSIPYRFELMTLFGKITNEKIKSLQTKEDLKTGNYHILTVRSAWYGPFIDELRKQTDSAAYIDEISTPSGRFKMLWFDRVDLVIADALAGTWEVKRMDFGNVVKPLPIAINDDVVHLMFSKKSVSPDTVRLFNQAIVKFNQETDEHEKVYEQFIPQNIQPLYDPPPKP